MRRCGGHVAVPRRAIIHLIMHFICAPPHAPRPLQARRRDRRAVRSHSSYGSIPHASSPGDACSEAVQI
ncbi:jg1833 [Pararge aegeria aegeria]|uniref:Jg1833 protein n=1 Tax=Pararge aegeria aegeria TaxID=348720 RepID=A0A8S4QXB2_9NEOP|nr:jg1833 [Pararge aegeria aegeria]